MFILFHSFRSGNQYRDSCHTIFTSFSQFLHEIIAEIHGNIIAGWLPRLFNQMFTQPYFRPNPLTPFPWHGMGESLSLSERPPPER